MSKGTALVTHPIHTLLAKRHSPYAFDAHREVNREDLMSLFEAARWSMSSYNAQPWRYIVGVKGRSQGTWDKLYSVLLKGNQPWAINAPVLVLGIVEKNFERDGKPNKAASHDLGAASALLTVEATAHGLVVHQMIGIDSEAAHAVFGLTESQEALTGLAIGYEGSAEVIPEEYARRDLCERMRKPLTDIILEGDL